MVYSWLAENRKWNTATQAKFKQADKQTWRLSLEVWLLSSTPCPLLGEDGLCSAYEARPMVCRTMYSRGEAHYCHPHRLREGMLLPRTSVMLAWSEIEKKLVRASQALLPFATAVLLGGRVVREEIGFQDCTILNLEALRKW
jgi:Fe-S-cluster containining protein